MRHVLLALGLAGCGRVGFDAGGGDGSGPDVAAACGHLFCDDLNGGAMSPLWSGTEIDQAGNLLLDPGFGRTGGSLEAFGDTGSSRAVRFVDVFPSTASDSWARLMLFAPSAETLDMEPVEIMDAGRSIEYVFSLYDTDVDIHAHGVAGDFNVTQPNAVPRDRWTCYELHVKWASDASGAVELYQDGVRVAQTAAVTNASGGRTAPRLAIGIVAKPTTGAQRIWADDVAADTTRIGCP